LILVVLFAFLVNAAVDSGTHRTNRSEDAGRFPENSMKLGIEGPAGRENPSSCGVSCFEANMGEIMRLSGIWS
jgi:hypothetical protein